MWQVINVSGNDGENVERHERRRWPLRKEYVMMFVAIGIGLFFISLYAWGKGGAAVFATASLLSGASLLGGLLLGFLFAIPRSVQASAPEAPAARPASGAAPQSPTGGWREYGSNTSLEQISDWLTKILIGAGLAQMALIPSQLQTVGRYWSVALGDQPGAGHFALAIMGYFLFCGFLMGYLWTRIDFYRVLTESERDLMDLNARQQELEHQQEGLDARLQKDRQQRETDLGAEKLVQRQLDQIEDDQPVPQEQLNEAIQRASDEVRSLIFRKAQKQRHDFWETDKTRMAHTIPVFRALIANDARKQYHRNFGQLGYALKDKLPPDWPAAEEALTTAIQIRNQSDEARNRWRWYEFNRATCRIAQDPNFLADPPSPSQPEARQRILADLREAASEPEVRIKIETEEWITRWMGLNGLTMADLTADSAPA